MTGASGFIGSGLVAKLSEQGYDVRALMRPTASNEFLKGVKFTRIAGDLLEVESLKRACENTDIVVHLAGLTAAKNREEYFRFNAQGTKNLADAAFNSGSVKKFIYISSQAAAGPSAGLSPKVEQDPDHPISMYGESKLRGELYLDELKGKLPFIVLRPTSVYGPRDRGIYVFFKMIQKSWMPILPSRTPTGHKYYNFVHVEDLIESIRLSINASESCFQNGERYFINDGQIYTFDRMMSLIAEGLKTKPIRVKLPSSLLSFAALSGSLLGKALKVNIPFNRDRFQDMIPDYWICSSQKAADQLQFKPKYTLESGIPQTVAWYKVNGWL